MWIILALTSAIAISARNLLSKKSVENTSQYLTMWLTVVGVWLFSTVIIVFAGIEIDDPFFWQLVAIRVVFDTIAFVTFIKALDLEEVSYVIPLLGFLPVTSSVSSYFINGQSVPLMAIFGILIIVISGVMLFANEVNLTKNTNRRNLIKATIFVSITILGWTIVDPIHKEAIDRSTPYTYFFISNVIFAIVFTVLLLINEPKSLKKIWRNEYPPAVYLLGPILGVEFLSQLLALTTGLTAAVVALKTTNIAFSAIAAWWLFGEKLNKLKLIGITGMIVGVILIVMG